MLAQSLKYLGTPAMVRRTVRLETYEPRSTEMTIPLNKTMQSPRHEHRQNRRPMQLQTLTKNYRWKMDLNLNWECEWKRSEMKLKGGLADVNETKRKKRQHSHSIVK
jgi:hypothetical protein